MSIRKTDQGTYLLDTRAAGVRIRRQFPTDRDAKRFEAELLQGYIPAPSRATLSMALDALMSERWAYCRDYRSIQSVAKRLLESMGNLKLSAITTSTINSWISRELHSGLSVGTVKRRLSTLRSAMQWGVDGGYIRRIPVYRSPGVARPRTVEFTADEIRDITRLFGEHEKPEMALYTRLLAQTGMRPSEAMRLSKASFDLARVRVRVDGRKTRMPRYVPLGASIVEALGYLLDRAPTKGRIWSFSRDQYMRVWTKVRAAMGRQNDGDFIPYALRHTAATRMARAGVPIGSIMAVMGHASIATTQRYMHASEQDLTLAIVSLEAL